MADQLAVAIAVQVTGDEAGRYAEGAGAGEEGVGVVLADTGTPGEGFGCGAVDGGDAGLVGHVFVQGLHQGDEPVAPGVGRAALVGEGTQGIVRCGQPGAAQERQRGLGIVLGFAALVDLHLATGGDDDGLMGLVQGQHVEDVAVWVQLRAHRAWQVQLPAQHVLSLAVVGGQAQVLDARANLVVVAIGGFVADGQFHTASR